MMIKSRFSLKKTQQSNITNVDHRQKSKRKPKTYNNHFPLQQLTKSITIPLRQQQTNKLRN